MRHGRGEDLFQRKRYPNYRNVTSMEKNGALRIKISAVSNWGFYAGGLTIISAVFAGGCWIFLPPLFSVRTLTEALALLLAIAFLLLWCGIGARFVLENLCSVELLVGNGIFCWRYRILRWSKAFEAQQRDVTAVTAKARWYRNRLSVTAGGRTYSLDSLLDEDLAIISRELRLALPGITPLSGR
jgi:hypothetical protein